MSQVTAENQQTSVDSSPSEIFSSADRNSSTNEISFVNHGNGKRKHSDPFMSNNASQEQDKENIRPAKKARSSPEPTSRHFSLQNSSHPSTEEGGQDDSLMHMDNDVNGHEMSMDSNWKNEKSTTKFRSSMEHDNVVPNVNESGQQVERQRETQKEGQPSRMRASSVKTPQKQHYRQMGAFQQTFKKITQEDRDRATQMVNDEKRYWATNFVNKFAQEGNRSLQGKDDDVHQVFSQMQTLSEEFGFTLQIPEIVVIGMQSDGKSTFVEALLGFQFNTVDTQIGTRRPLLLMMKNDQSCEEPICTFTTSDSNSSFNAHSTPVDRIEEEIRRRTEDRCGPNSVSPVPIAIQIRYKYCATLNVYDMPGLRTSKTDPLASKIYRMNMHMIKEKNRTIVCLEESTVEWCNSQIRPLLLKVDSQSERTIFVTTKFGNRAKQFKSTAEINGYISTDGHLQGNRVFFISLPSGAQARNLDVQAFKESILNTHLADVRTLCLIGFDYDSHMKSIGFMRLKHHLEENLNQRYLRSITPIANRLQVQLEKRQVLASKLQDEIDRMEKENVEQVISNAICNYLSSVYKALEGTLELDPATNGMTLEDEKRESNCSAWSNESLDIVVRNSHLKLYGGSQLDRLLAEFEIVAHAQEFPATTDDEVAVTIGLNNLHTGPNFESGASDLARAKCRNTLHPLVDILIERAKFIMKNTFHVVAEHLLANKKRDILHKRSVSDLSEQHVPSISITAIGNVDNQQGNQSSGGGINIEPFFAAAQKTSNEFIEAVLTRMKWKADAEFDVFSRIIDWELMGYCGEQRMDYDLLNPSHDDIKSRVMDIVEKQHTGSAATIFGDDLRRNLSESHCQTIKTVAARLFGGVRLLFVKYVRAKFNAFFINPIFTEMDQYLRNHFNALGSDNLKELVGLQIHKMKSDQEKVAKHVTKAQGMLDKVQHVQNRLEEIAKDLEGQRR